MSETTFERRLAQLKDQLMQHPHKHELLQLAHEQLLDDTDVLPSTGIQDLVEAHQ
jgi:hypothetical protein